MWTRIITLAWKEFLALFKEKQSRFVVIAPPLIQVLIFGYAATFDLNRAPFAVYDQDHGAAAHALVARFEASDNFKLIGAVDSEARARAVIDDGQALLVLRIAPNFSRRLRGDGTTHVQAILDARNSNTAMLALNYSREIVDGFNREWARTHPAPASTGTVEVRAWFNPNLESRWFFLPGIVGMITLVVTMTVVSLSVAREREQGTFDQLLVTPITPAEIILGKSLPGLAIGMFEASMITLVAVFWFNIPLLGSLLTLYAGLLLFLLSAIGMGLMISALSVTLQQALLGSFLFMVPAVILSGFATPISNMPMAVQYITYADPLRYFLVIIRAVFLEGASFPVLAKQFWPMAVIALASLSAAGWLFRHRLN